MRQVTRLHTGEGSRDETGYKTTNRRREQRLDRLQDYKQEKGAEMRQVTRLHTGEGSRDETGYKTTNRSREQR